VGKDLIDKADLLVLSDYAARISDTDMLNPLDVGPVLQGLYGEVGGIMSTAKKHVREGSAYPGFRRAAEEEFGDTLWYLAAICRRQHIRLDELFATAASSKNRDTTTSGNDTFDGTLVDKLIPPMTDTVDTALFRLGKAAAALLGAEIDRGMMEALAMDYLNALHLSKLKLVDIADSNLRKAIGAFLAPRADNLVDFDKEFGVEEQLPREFRIRVNQRGSGKSYLQWNGVFIGDPLTDNIADPDGYRFHDVFHFAYAAVLHWSPVVRSLIKHKRKSSAEYDEAQDSGRAIVVEEGLTAWIFTRARELNYFEGQERVSLGVLKTIGEFVTGYEVSQCPLKLWEKAILEGYKVFRQIRAARGGWIIGDRTLRTIHYASLEAFT
jgi:hypothetical protein